SAAPYSVTWNTERQVTTESPLIERAFCCPGCVKPKKRRRSFPMIGGVFLWVDQKSQRVVTITLRGSGVIDNGF
ncbi:hypothetical protein, partial [Pseudomonas salomonii]|uniref:hypothetical protein n=1 Tax=Pseudomonas salomonii TaxID=191391 RepID=UPI001C7E63ED